MHLHKKYKKNDAFTQKKLNKKNEELLAKCSILQRKNRTLREILLKNQE